MCAQSPQSCLTRTVTCQAPQSMGLSGQEYWTGLPFLLPRDLPDPRIKPSSPKAPELAGGFFTAEPPGKPGTVKWKGWLN